MDGEGEAGGDAPLRHRRLKQRPEGHESGERKVGQIKHAASRASVEVAAVPACDRAVIRPSSHHGVIRRVQVAAVLQRGQCLVQVIAQVGQ